MKIILICGGAGYIGPHRVTTIEDIIESAWNWHKDHKKGFNE